MADASFQKEFLDTHNAYRAKHCVPPLSFSADLNDSAQKWADHLLSLGVMSHSDTKNGENIYSRLSSEPLTGKDAVDAWYSEVANYNWSNPGFGSNTGHFTQVVWKDSTNLGVGVATVGTKAYVVAQYAPAGNMNAPGYFESNVLQKGSGTSGPTGNTTDGEADQSPGRCCITCTPS